MEDLLILPNGLIIKENEMIDLNRIDDNFINSIEDIEIPANDILQNMFVDNKFKEEIGSYKDYLKSILLSSKEKDRKEIIQSFKSDYFVNNLRYAYTTLSNTYNNKDLVKVNLDSFFKNNHIAYGKNVLSIVTNYNYMRKFNILFKDELDKIYLGSSIKNVESVINESIITGQKIRRELQSLAVESFEKNRQLLKQNLEFITREKGIIKSSDVNSSNKYYLYNDLYKNMENYDNERLSKPSELLNNSEYSHYFIGVRSYIRDILDKANPNLMDDLDKLYKTEEFDKFFHSMNAVKEWKELNVIERMENLRDEFLTRILVVSIYDNALDYKEKNIKNKTEDLIIKEINNSFIKSNNNIDYLKYHLDKDALIMFTMDNINSFFENNSSQTKLKAKIKDSIRNQVLKAYSPSKSYMSVQPKKAKQIFNRTREEQENLENTLKYDVLNPPISNSIRNEKIEQTKVLMNKYQNADKKYKDKLFIDLLKTFNYYMYATREYDILNYLQETQKISDKEDVKILPKKIYTMNNTRFNKMDRLIYSLYNSNRIAHTIGDTNAYTTFDDSLIVNEDRGADKNRRERYLVKYTTLSRYGLEVDWINESIEKYMNNESLSIYNLIDKKAKQDIINNLKVITKNSNYYKKEEINESNIDEIIKTLEDIKDNKNNDKEIEKKNRRVRDSVAVYAKERNLFFNLKHMLIDEVKKRAEKDSNKKLEDMDYNDKLKQFQRRHYIVEFQSDKKSKNAVLVCFDEKFNLPFSVHYVDNDITFNKEKLIKNEKVTNHLAQTGLVENKEIIPNSVSRYIEIKKGGFFDTDPKTNDQNKNNDIVKASNLVNISLRTPTDIKDLTNEEISKHFFKVDKARKSVFMKYSINSGEEEKPQLSNVVMEEFDKLIREAIKRDDFKITKEDQFNLIGDRYDVQYRNKHIRIPAEYLFEETKNVIENNESKKR